MELLSVIRRWRYRDHYSIREISRRTGLSRNTGDVHTIRLTSILPARAPGRAGAPLFLLTNYQRVRSDSRPKIAYTYLP